MPPARTPPGSLTVSPPPYPFHPDLMDLVQDEWGQSPRLPAGPVSRRDLRSHGLHWVRAAEAGDWTPALIGVGDPSRRRHPRAGDIPSTTDITPADGTSGRAAVTDAPPAGDGATWAPPCRMATVPHHSLVA